MSNKVKNAPTNTGMHGKWGLTGLIRGKMFFTANHGSEMFLASKYKMSTSQIEVLETSGQQIHVDESVNET